MRKLPVKARALLIIAVLCCAALSVYAVMQGIPRADVRFAALLAMAVISARMKVRLPGLDSNMAMNLPFIVSGLVQLSLPLAIVVGMVSTFAQCLPGRGKKMKGIQAVFNICTVANAIALSFLFTSYIAKAALIPEKPALIVLGTFAFFLTDSVPVAAIVSATGGGKMGKLWAEMTVLAFPHFLLSAGVAIIIVTTSHFAGVAWSLALPVMFLVYHSFRRYMHNVNAVERVLQPAANQVTA